MNFKFIFFFNYYVIKNICMVLYIIFYICIVKFLYYDDRNMKGNNMYI